MAIMDRLGGLDQLDNPTRSVLPTDPTFDPMLFLTLVHREVGYHELIGSVDRLTSKLANFFFIVSLFCFPYILNNLSAPYVSFVHRQNKYSAQTVAELGAREFSSICEMC